MVLICKMMEYKLKSLAIIQCDGLKMATFTELGRKQEELFNASRSNIKSKRKHLTEFVIDDEMVNSSILDHFCGLRALSIATDHLSGTMVLW